MRSKLAALILAAGLATLGQYALVQRCDEAARALVLRLIPYGQLGYEKLWPWFWGGGHVWNVSFEPAGLLQLNLQTPPGYRLRARELRVHWIDPGWFSGMPTVSGSLQGLVLPVPERRSPAPEPGTPGPMPSLHELGYRALQFNAGFRARFIPEARLLLLQVEGRAVDIGAFHMKLHLEGDAATFKRAPDRILLRRLELSFSDGGLLQRYREVAAARRGVSATELTQVLQQALDGIAQTPAWTWDPASTQALRQALADPKSFQAQLDPPAQVLLRNIRLYRPAIWGRELGFSLEH